MCNIVLRYCQFIGEFSIRNYILGSELYIFNSTPYNMLTFLQFSTRTSGDVDEGPGRPFLIVVAVTQFQFAACAVEPYDFCSAPCNCKLNGSAK